MRVRWAHFSGHVAIDAASERGFTYAWPRSTRLKRISIGTSRARVLRHIPGPVAIPPGAWCEMPLEVISGHGFKLGVCELASGSREPGTLLDDRLTIACAKAQSEFSNCNGPEAPMQGRKFIRGTRAQGPGAAVI